MKEKSKSFNKTLFLPLTCAFLSSLVLIGWLFNFDFLRRPFAGLIAMNPLTALLLLLTSVALFILIKRYPSKKIAWLVSFISLGVLIAATIKLGGDLLGTDTEIDTSLFKNKFKIDSHGILMNRMAPNTAFNFILSSIAILMANLKFGKNQYPSQYIAVLIASIGLFSVIGYIYDLAPFYGSLAFMPMSTQSAVCFLLIAVSILFIHPDKGFMSEFTSEELGAVISRKFIPATIIAQTCIGLLFLFIYHRFDLPLELVLGILITANTVLGIQFVYFNAKIINKKNALLRNSQKETKEIANRLKIATQSSEIGIWDMDIQTGEIIWDEQIYKLFGITSDTYKNATVAKNNGVHPDDYENLKVLLARSIEEKTAYSCEFRVIWPDKSIHYIKSIGTVETNKNGEITRFIGTKWDITPSKETELALQEYKYFFVENNDLAGIANAEGHFDMVNPNFEKALGYSFKELTENPFSKFIHPDDLAPTLKTYQEQVKGKSVIHFVNRYIKKNGEFVWLDWNAKTNEETGKLYAIARDITEQKLLTEEIEKNNLFLDTIIENIPNMIFVKEAKELNFVRFNRAGEDLIGYSRKDLLGKNDFDFFPFDQAELFTTQDREVFDSGELMVLEEEKLTTAKSEKWVRTKKIPVHDSQGEPMYLIGISEDITERKKKDELLKDQANRLKSANEELESFSYSVSHDLRAPLRSLQGFSNALLTKHKGELDEESDRWLDFIGSNADRMGVLINDMLSFSKLTRTDLVKADVDMRAVAQDVFDAEKNNYEGKPILFDLEDIPNANGDSAMLRQVWQNLISNALKYSFKKDEIKIKISGETKDGLLSYTIKDNGVGFDEKYKHKLFTVFQRLHTEADFEGTGVGLAIANRIIKKHDGTIEANSELDLGTEFIFTLPIQ